MKCDRCNKETVCEYIQMEAYNYCYSCFSFLTGISLEELKKPIVTNCYCCNKKLCDKYDPTPFKSCDYICIHNRINNYLLVVCCKCYDKWFQIRHKKVQI